MKLTRIFAGVAAVAVATCAMAITSFAAVTNDNNGGNGYMVDLSTVENAFGGIRGAVVTMTLADGWTETGAGGGIVFQGDGVSWDDGSKEFNISGEGTANVEDVVNSTVSGSTLTCTYDFGGVIFAETATWGQLIVQSWWGADVTVDDIKYIDLDGNVIGEEPSDDTPADDTPADDTPADDTPADDTPTDDTPADDTPADDTPADDTPAEDDTATTTTTAAAADDNATTTTTAAAGSAATGVEGVASVVALLTIAGAAVVVTKKN